MLKQVNWREKLDTFSDHWSPRVVATMNDHDVMVVRVEGEFVWHSHPETDDFFLILDGELEIELRDRTITLGPGELYVVPKRGGAPSRRAERRGPDVADRAVGHAQHWRRTNGCAQVGDLTAITGFRPSFGAITCVWVSAQPTVAAQVGVFADRSAPLASAVDEESDHALGTARR